MEALSGHSANYNRYRRNGDMEDLRGLDAILTWVQGHLSCSNQNSRATFLSELCRRIRGYDGAPYLMEQSLEALAEVLNEGNPVDVFIYVLLCPLGRCAGVSRDTCTGSYFGVIEEPSSRGMFIHCLILQKHTSLLQNLAIGKYSCATSLFSGA